MDIRANIIQNVVNHLSGRVNNDIINIVQDTLVIELNQYELQERCTEVVVLDKSNEKLLRRFIATKRVEGIAESTLRRYYEMNMKLIDFLKKPINEITTYDIRFYLSLKREQDGVSNRTLDGMRRVYSSFFKWLSAEGFISSNPCATLKQRRDKKTVKKPYSATEMEKLRKACSGNIRNLALIDFMYSTGCRVSEVSKLDIMDVDFENMQCTVLGKGNKERIVYLTEVAAMNLKEYLKTRHDLSEALFIGKGGKRLSKNGMEAMFRTLGEKASIENVHPHRFRRTLATNLLDHGMNIQEVATILGHADLKTTQVYCYISQKYVESSYRKFSF